MGQAGRFVCSPDFFCLHPFRPLTPSAPFTPAGPLGDARYSPGHLSPQASRPWGAERTGSGSPPLSLPAGLECKVLGLETAKVMSSRPGLGLAGVGFPGLTSGGCLPPGGRPALGSSSDIDTSVWLTIGSGTGLASSSQRPAKLPLSRQGIPAREGGSGQEKRRKLRLRMLELETSPGPGCTWLCQDPLGT